MLRPKKIPPEEKPFKRRTRPTPQASRLMVTSTLAGLGMVIVLAVVFIPRALQQESQPQVPTLYLRAEPTVVDGTWRVNVTQVSLSLPLSAYEVEVTHLGSPLVNRTSLLNISGPPGWFYDTDGDGHLSVGDVFLVDGNPDAATRLFVYHVPSGKRIGFTTFP